jgi:hypothetical protein
VSIANVATRWVLDHDFVGAVIIGESLRNPPVAALPTGMLQVPDSGSVTTPMIIEQSSGGG